MRIGQSTDIHQFGEGEFFTLGGVKIAYDKKLIGHSDADALIHAIAEAILGALALGDLGHHFSDTDEKWKGIDSRVILREVVKMMKERGYVVGNVDSLIMVEKPKMAPYIEEMRKNIAQDLECDLERVNVKATRGEKMGFVGRGEGIMCQAVILLEEKDV